MLNTHEDAASKINGEIERLVRKLQSMNPSNQPEIYTSICENVKTLSQASAALVVPQPEVE